MSIKLPNLNSIEEYYQEIVDATHPDYKDCIEAKETMWEYWKLVNAELAAEFSEKNMPDEIYDLKDSWL